jgi:hypothetical protein
MEVTVGWRDQWETSGAWEKEGMITDWKTSDFFVVHTTNKKSLSVLPVHSSRGRQHFWTKTSESFVFLADRAGAKVSSADVSRQARTDVLCQARPGV